MINLSRREFLGISASGVGALWLEGARPASALSSSPARTIDALYTSFEDPDHKYSMRPFWFWNGKLEAKELDRQIRLMVEQGVYGAYAHNRDGLETPYLSEEWWQVLGEALDSARKAGFSLCMVDEFEWPSGEARDYWMPGPNKSRVIEKNPEYLMRQLHPTGNVVHGHDRVEVRLPEETTLVVAGKITSPGKIDGDSLQLLNFEPGARALNWQAPAGEWVVTTYNLEQAQTTDGGTVDLMNPDAVREFINIYYEEFYRRHGEHFGAAMPATFADHEGAYGGRIGWTPRLFETFRAKKGYDLQPLLPALTGNIGAKTEKIRCDYFDVVSDLYTDSFFKQVSSWCEAHKLGYSAHVWEESLFFGPWAQGDYFRILRALNKPGCDSLAEWGLQPAWLKEVASVADFEHRPLVCENQGAQGSDGYLSPGRMKHVSNCLGAWNVAEFIPHAFDYDIHRINFAPDWFLSQPFMPYFRRYADLLRRISFMNSDSHHVADVLLYYPQVSVWGQSGPAFTVTNFGDILEGETWGADAAETQSQFTELKVRLADHQLDYKVADDSYLAESTLDGNTLAIADSRFRTLVLPPMSTIKLATAQRIRDFYEAGGSVVAIGGLPFISVENGRDDAELKSLWYSMFDLAPSQETYTSRSNVAGGKACFVLRSVPNAVQLLLQCCERDLEVTEGPTDDLYFLHKKKSGLDFYWVVNNAASTRTNILRLHAIGRAERWDADSGKRSSIFYQSETEHTVVRLVLGPWQAAYVVLDPAGPRQNLELKQTNLDDFDISDSATREPIIQARTTVRNEPAFIEMEKGGTRYRGEYKPAPNHPLEITGDWTVEVEGGVIPQPYALAKDDPMGRGTRERWFDEKISNLDWNPLWLSPINCSVREWNFIGPFPNPDDHGLEHKYAPESGIDYSATYEGDGGQELRWLTLDAGKEVIERGPGTWMMFPAQPGKGVYDRASFLVDYKKAIDPKRALQGTFYAQTNFHASGGQDAVLVLITPNPASAFVNGQQVYSRWLRPSYHEQADGFAIRIPVKLQAGWNSVLLKFLHNFHKGSPAQQGTPGQFTCRVENASGGFIADLVSNPRQVSAERMQHNEGFRWLRFPVSPMAAKLRVPDLQQAWTAYVDGKVVAASKEIACRGARCVVIRVDSREILSQPFHFATSPTEMPLGTWNTPGLERFSGRMTYQKEVDVPGSLLKEKLLLDCGAVGVAAEVWVNGKHIGVEPWAPYVFDVTSAIRLGKNHLKVSVVNTEANARSVGRSVDLVKNIDLNGWHGPVQLVPYLVRDIPCKVV